MSSALRSGHARGVRTNRTSKPSSKKCACGRDWCRQPVGEGDSVSWPMKAKKREEYRKALAMSTEYADKLVPKRDRLWRKHWAEEHINRTGKVITVKGPPSRPWAEVKGEVESARQAKHAAEARARAVDTVREKLPTMSPDTRAAVQLLLDEVAASEQRAAMASADVAALRVRLAIAEDERRSSRKRARPCPLGGGRRLDDECQSPASRSL